MACESFISPMPIDRAVCRIIWANAVCDKGCILIPRAIEAQMFYVKVGRIARCLLGANMDLLFRRLFVCWVIGHVWLYTPFRGRAVRKVCMRCLLEREIRRR